MGVGPQLTRADRAGGKKFGRCFAVENTDRCCHVKFRIDRIGWENSDFEVCCLSCHARNVAEAKDLRFDTIVT